MIFDIFGAVNLTAIAVVEPAILILNSRLDAARQRRLAYLAGGWLGMVSCLAAAGAFSLPVIGTAAIGMAVVLPLIAVLGLRARWDTLRDLARGTPLPVLVGLNAGRVLGVQFVLLYAMGRLPAAFALTAGLGDMLVAALAVPLALAMRRGEAGWRRYALAWNALGTLDLVTALTLGVGSSPGFPLRFIFQQPDTGIMGSLPWLLIPGFLVPFYLITHLFIFARLLGAREPRGEQRLGGLAA
jgi:hypothetical protein